MEHDEMPPPMGDTATPSPAIALDEAATDGPLIEIEESLTIELIALVEPDELATSTTLSKDEVPPVAAEARTPASAEVAPAPPPEAAPDSDSAPVVQEAVAQADTRPTQTAPDVDEMQAPLAATDVLPEGAEPDRAEAASIIVVASADASLETAGDELISAEAETGKQAANPLPAPDQDAAKASMAAVVVAEATGVAPADTLPAPVVAEPSVDASSLVGATTTPIAATAERASLDVAVPVAAGDTEAPLSDDAALSLVANPAAWAPAAAAAPAACEPIQVERGRATVPLIADLASVAESPPNAYQMDQPGAALDDEPEPALPEPAYGTAPAVATGNRLAGDVLQDARAPEQPDVDPSLRVVEALRREMQANAALRRDPHAHATRPLPRRRPARRRHALALTIIEILLVLLVSFAGTFVALDARARLSQARLLAHAGLQHIEDIRALFSGPDKLSAALNTTTLARAQGDLTAAQGDFARLRGVLGQGSFSIAAHTPFASGPIQAAANLAAAADEACQGGLLALHGMQLVAPIVAGGIFSSSKPPGSASNLTTSTVPQLTAALDGALQHLDTAVAYAQQANLAALPTSLVSAQQRQELQGAIAQWPALRPLVLQARDFLADVPALLGLTSPANYLIELMDRTELRPGGGFIGNYAVITIANGKVQPFTISDTYLIDEPYLSRNGGSVHVPAAYSWWRWADFYGLRDSNFSMDFPTSAQLGMQQLVREGGPQTQGVVALTVPAIARVLQVTGSIPMPLYGQTVTVQNLESLIHYYQEAVGHDPLTGLPNSDLLSSSRKRFTALLARALLDKLHSLSTAQLVEIGKGALTSLRLKELQVYVTVPQAESLLTKYGLDGGVSHGPGDGVTIVDANDGANKANQFVTVTYRDNVTLDSQGTATHQLTITYNFRVTDPSQLFGPDLYENYLRIYVPPGAQLTHLDGLHNTFGKDQINHSDLSWRQMWGGYILVQDGTPYVLHVSWRVPHAATIDAKGTWTYQLTYQHQAGANQALTLAVSVSGQRLPVVQYNATLDSDRTFTATYRGP